MRYIGTLCLILLFVFCLPLAAQDNRAMERIEAARESGATTLDLSNLGLREIPPQVWELTQLEDLRLNFNYIQTIPPEIAQLSNLKILYISTNGIRELPPEIGQLTHLEILQANINALTTVPPEIGNLRNLKHLYLAQNQLRDLPVEIGNLSQLNALTINTNPLISPPAEVIAEGLPAIQAYLKAQTAYHLRKSAYGLILMISPIVGLIAVGAIYYVSRSGKRKKKKRE